MSTPALIWRGELCQCRPDPDALMHLHGVRLTTKALDRRNACRRECATIEQRLLLLNMTFGPLRCGDPLPA